jgi:hypothetical protein
MQTTAAEEQALGEYSPRVGDEAPPLKHASPEKSKVHLMGPTQYLSALGKCAAELETQVSTRCAAPSPCALPRLHLCDTNSQGSNYEQPLRLSIHYH